MSEDTNPEDMEDLAAQEHRSWAKRTHYMLSEIEKGLESWRYEPGGICDAPEMFQYLPCIER